MSESIDWSKVPGAFDVVPEKTLEKDEILSPQVMPEVEEAKEVLENLQETLGLNQQQANSICLSVIENWVSAAEIATILDCSRMTVTSYLKELFPDKIVHGAKTKVTKSMAEAIVMKMGLVNHPNAINLTERFKNLEVGGVNQGLIALMRASAWLKGDTQALALGFKALEQRNLELERKVTCLQIEATEAKRQRDIYARSYDDAERRTKELEAQLEEEDEFKFQIQAKRATRKGKTKAKEEARQAYFNGELDYEEFIRIVREIGE